MSKQKQQGTKLETFVAKMLGGERIAEGGKNDKGDVKFRWNDLDFYVECKARQSLNVTRELAKSISKSKSQFTALIWKRLVKTSKSKRQPDGVPIIVCLTLETFLEIVESKVDNEYFEPPFWKELPSPKTNQ
jgi:hypothetical protein|tara:strand:+ start:5853 stop:6248 length:396 start_codon:yes stop_codon:yes gene_type:complete